MLLLAGNLTLPIKWLSKLKCSLRKGGALVPPFLLQINLVHTSPEYRQ